MAAAVALSQNNVLALNTRRLAAEELDWIADTETIDPYLADQVHYTEFGAQELARIEVASLMSLVDFDLVLGDCNLDGFVNFGDIPPLSDALTTGIYLEQGDCNLDGDVNFLDVPSFVAILTARF